MLHLVTILQKYEIFSLSQNCYMIVDLQETCINCKVCVVFPPKGSDRHCDC